MYNFSRCKLCEKPTAQPIFQLKAGTIYCCKQCDFHFLNQLDDIATIEADSSGLTDKAWNYIETRVDESVILRTQRLELVKEFVSLPGAKCLDLGAGVGQFLQLLKQEQAEGIGIDPSHVRRLYAERKFELCLRKELIDEDYWQSGFHEYFDVICLWDVIEHINFPAETLAMALRLLKPGGHLFLDTPSRETLAYRISQNLYRLSGGQLPLFLDTFYSNAPYGHKQIFTRHQLQQLLERLGLQLCSLQKSYPKNRFVSDKVILAGRKANNS